MTTRVQITYKCNRGRATEATGRVRLLDHYEGTLLRPGCFEPIELEQAFKEGVVFKILVEELRAGAWHQVYNGDGSPRTFTTSPWRSSSSFLRVRNSRVLRRLPSLP